MLSSNIITFLVPWITIGLELDEDNALVASDDEDGSSQSSSSSLAGSKEEQ